MCGMQHGETSVSSSLNAFDLSETLSGSHVRIQKTKLNFAKCIYV